ncbi:unnamed protein product [Pylaiella littoralis]
MGYSKAAVIGSTALVSSLWTCCAFVAPSSSLSMGRAATAAAVRSGRSTSTARNGVVGPIMALKGLARKAKEAQVSKDMEDLRSSEPDSPVFKILEQAEAGTGAGDDPEYPLSSVLRKNEGTLSVVAEYRQILKSGFIDGMLAPELLCPLIRNGGAACIAVATEPQTGGCSDADLAKVVTEQENSRGDFPGPMPVIVRDLVISEFEIARAKAAGASGVTVVLALVGAERAAELAGFCKKLGMEAVVQTTSQEEIEQAAASEDISIISVVGKGLEGATELLPHIPERVVSVVHVDRTSDECLDEIEDCWKLRDAGYNTVWVSEVLYKGGMTQADESAEAIIKAIRAKGSVKYGRARGMSGKGEGAKEYLGYLAQ